MAINGRHLRGRAPRIECKMRASRPAANGFNDWLDVAVPVLCACQANSSQAFDLLGRRLKPIRPHGTRHKTAWQACKTDKTGRILRIKCGPLCFFRKFIRLYRFYTPATRFYVRCYTVLTVLHACQHFASCTFVDPVYSWNSRC